jgi:hypothetical protein
MVSLELYFDHPQFRSLYCPAGTQFGGRFDVSHLNNWQHAASYPAFFLAGVIDITQAVLLSSLTGQREGWSVGSTQYANANYNSAPSSSLAAPPRAGQAAIALAFSTMSFLMGTHEKHEPLDAMMHWCLFFAMSLATVLCFVELHAPNNPTVSITKGAATVLLGAWFCVVARTMFHNDDNNDHENGSSSSSLPQWSTEYHGGVMFTPVLFSSLVVLVLFCTLVVFIVLLLLQRRFHFVDKLVDDYGTAAFTEGNTYTSNTTIRDDNIMQYCLVDTSQDRIDKAALAMEMNASKDRQHHQTQWQYHPTSPSHLCDRSSMFSEDSAQVSDNEKQLNNNNNSSSSSNHHRRNHYERDGSFEMARLGDKYHHERVNNVV